MNAALVYLVATSLGNAVRARARRLREPKYLAALAAGAGYFWLFFWRPLVRGTAGRLATEAGAAAGLLEPVGALALLVAVGLAWMFDRERAALHFSEAEAAFLFPAPVPRRTLVHYKLLRTQLGLLGSAVLLAVIFRRGSLLGGDPFIRAAGWWLVFATLNLHLLGASFARERWLDCGLHPGRRRWLVGGGAVALGAVAWLGLRPSVAAPGPADLADAPAVLGYLGRVLAQPPVGWLLAPFALVMRPGLARTGAEFWTAAGPALLVLGAHYWWVVRSSVAFEEASLAWATRQAKRAAAWRAGRWHAAEERPARRRPAPFALAGTGWAPTAFLWRNLLALGPLARLRTWLVAVAVVVTGYFWLAADPGRVVALKVAGGFGVMAGVCLVVVGPMIAQREIRQTLGQLEVTKTYPLPGWQIVLGELLTPLVLLVFAEWLCLLLAVLGLGTTTGGPRVALVLGAWGGAGIALLVPPLAGLLLCVPFAGILFFPAWSQPVGQHGGGLEAMGTRLIFFAGYVVVLVVALIPAAGAAALVAFIAHWLGGPLAALVGALGVATVVLGAEFAGAVAWLGWRWERLDAAQELPR